MSINWQLTLPLEQRQAVASVGLAGLMTIAKLDGTPSPRALAAIRGVRDHLLQVELKLCLLYTSPSPRDATLSRMPSSA